MMDHEKHEIHETGPTEFPPGPGRAARNATLPTGLPARFRAFRGSSSDRSVPIRIVFSASWALCGESSSGRSRGGGERGADRPLRRGPEARIRSRKKMIDSEPAMLEICVFSSR